jgi:hypothetical protein
MMEAQRAVHGVGHAAKSSHESIPHAATLNGTGKTVKKTLKERVVRPRDVLNVTLIAKLNLERR